MSVIVIFVFAAFALTTRAARAAAALDHRAALLPLDRRRYGCRCAPRRAATTLAAAQSPPPSSPLCRCPRCRALASLATCPRLPRGRRAATFTAISAALTATLLHPRPPMVPLHQAAIAAMPSSPRRHHDRRPCYRRHLRRHTAADYCPRCHGSRFCSQSASARDPLADRRAATALVGQHTVVTTTTAVLNRATLPPPSPHHCYLRRPRPRRHDSERCHQLVTLTPLTAGLQQAVLWRSWAAT